MFIPLDKSNRLQGFTLVEMAIVLVVIGLLAGGIFVGQSLIRSAELNAVISEHSRYETAVRSFTQAYRGLPGDITNATSYWGTRAGNGHDSTCYSTPSTSTATCDGDGNGALGPNGEVGRFWQHLVNAKMIEGSYNGAIGVAQFGLPGVIGTNLPASKYPGAGWSIGTAQEINLDYDPNNGGSGLLGSNMDLGGGHVFAVGSPVAADLNNGCSDTNDAINATFSPQDAFSIDKKVDDGKPAEGNVIAAGPCTINNCATLTAYASTDNKRACALLFIADF